MPLPRSSESSVQGEWLAERRTGRKSSRSQFPALKSLLSGCFLEIHPLRNAVEGRNSCVRYPLHLNGRNIMRSAPLRGVMQAGMG